MISGDGITKLRMLPEMSKRWEKDLDIFYTDHAGQALYEYVALSSQLQHNYLLLEGWWYLHVFLMAIWILRN